MRKLNPEPRYLVSYNKMQIMTCTHSKTDTEHNCCQDEIAPLAGRHCALSLLYVLTKYSGPKPNTSTDQALPMTLDSFNFNCLLYNVVLTQKCEIL